MAGRLSLVPFRQCHTDGKIPRAASACAQSQTLLALRDGLTCLPGACAHTWSDPAKLVACTRSSMAVARRVAYASRMGRDKRATQL